MTTFIGFNTIDQFKKFTLTDFELIKRDLLNAFNIRPGQLPAGTQRAHGFQLRAGRRNHPEFVPLRR
jgi:hypothetical protein